MLNEKTEDDLYFLYKSGLKNIMAEVGTLSSLELNNLVNAALLKSDFEFIELLSRSLLLFDKKKIVEILNLILCDIVDHSDDSYSLLYEDLGLLFYHADFINNFVILNKDTKVFIDAVIEYARKRNGAVDTWLEKEKIRNKIYNLTIKPVVLTRY